MWLSKLLDLLFYPDSHISQRFYINASCFKNNINICSQEYLIQWHKANTTWTEIKQRILSDLGLIPRSEYLYVAAENQGLFSQLCFDTLKYQSIQGMLWYSEDILEIEFIRLPTLLVTSRFVCWFLLNSSHLFYLDSCHNHFLLSHT